MQAARPPITASGYLISPSDFESEHQIDPIHSDASGRGPRPPLTHMSQLLSFILKQGEHDPFSDNPDGPDAQFESTHIETRGQIAANLNEQARS